MQYFYNFIIQQSRSVLNTLRCKMFVKYETIFAFPIVFLRQNGIPSHIDGAVYFSNKDAHLKISGAKENIPVFNQEKDLIRFINKNDNTIHPDIIKKICE